MLAAQPVRLARLPSEPPALVAGALERRNRKPGSRKRKLELQPEEGGKTISWDPSPNVRETLPTPVRELQDFAPLTERERHSARQRPNDTKTRSLHAPNRAAQIHSSGFPVADLGWRQKIKHQWDETKTFYVPTRSQECLERRRGALRPEDATPVRRQPTRTRPC